MPPIPPTVQNPSRGKHLMLGILVGLVVATLLLAAAGYAALRTGVLQSPLQTYFFSRALSQNPSISGGDIKPDGTPQPLTAASSTKILVPKSYASGEYYVSLNATVNDYNRIVTALTDLQGRLVEINTQVASGKYAGLLDKLVVAKLLIDEEGEEIARFGRDLSALGIANQTTSDQITKSLTLTVVSTGGVLQGDLQKYFSLLDTLLSGAPPTAVQVAETAAQTKQTTASLSAFRASLDPLIQHFVEAIKKTASSTPAR